jgi:hypothetical protein
MVASDARANTLAMVAGDAIARTRSMVASDARANTLAMVAGDASNPRISLSLIDSMFSSASELTRASIVNASRSVIVRVVGVAVLVMAASVDVRIMHYRFAERNGLTIAKLQTRFAILQTRRRCE